MDVDNSKKTPRRGEQDSGTEEIYQMRREGMMLWVGAGGVLGVAALGGFVNGAVGVADVAWQSILGSLMGALYNGIGREEPGETVAEVWAKSSYGAVAAGICCAIIGAELITPIGDFGNGLLTVGLGMGGGAGAGLTAFGLYRPRKSDEIKMEREKRSGIVWELLGKHIGGEDREGENSDNRPDESNLRLRKEAPVMPSEGMDDRLSGPVIVKDE